MVVTQVKARDAMVLTQAVIRMAVVAMVVVAMEPTLVLITVKIQATVMSIAQTTILQL